MTRYPVVFLILATLTVGVTSSPAAAAEKNAREKLPNFVIVFTDDVSCRLT